MSDRPAAPALPAPKPDRPILQVLGNSHFRTLWGSSWMWNSSRWMWQIISGYIVLQLTDSPFLVQMVGVAFTGPQLLGAVLGGAIADSLGRKTTLLIAHGMNLTLAVFTAGLVLSGRAEAWHILVLTLLAGSANPLDSVTRRTFVSEIIPRPLLSFSLALEAMAMMGSGVVGPWIGGALVDVVPLGTAGAATPYMVITGLYVLSLVLLLRVPGHLARQAQRRGVGDTIASIGEGLRYVAGNRAVLGTLTLTLGWNFFFAPYQTLIPVIAVKELGVNSTLMGILGGAQGAGSLIGTLFIATRPGISRNSVYYVFGTLTALTCLLAFSLSTIYPLSVALLIVAGIGGSGFVTMQATLVLLAVREDMRARAMGALNMAIGVLPLGTLTLGILAQSIRPSLAVTIMASIGVVWVAFWGWRAKEMRKL